MHTYLSLSLGLIDIDLTAIQKTNNDNNTDENIDNNINNNNYIDPEIYGHRKVLQLFSMLKNQHAGYCRRGSSTKSSSTSIRKNSSQFKTKVSNENSKFQGVQQDNMTPTSKFSS